MVVPANEIKLQIMGYPLGSFPRFGYQETAAEERRERGLATRRAHARGHLRNEREILLAMEQVISTVTANNAEGETMLQDMKRRLARIRHKHDAGQRVYYTHLGETFQHFCRITGMSDEVPKFNRGQMKQFVVDLAEERLGARLLENLPRLRAESAQHAPQKPALSDWYADLTWKKTVLMI